MNDEFNNQVVQHLIQTAARISQRCEVVAYWHKALRDSGYSSSELDKAFTGCLQVIEALQTVNAMELNEAVIEACEQVVKGRAGLYFDSNVIGDIEIVLLARSRAYAAIRKNISELLAISATIPSREETMVDSLTPSRGRRRRHRQTNTQPEELVADTPSTNARRRRRPGSTSSNSSVAATESEQPRKRAAYRPTSPVSIKADVPVETVIAETQEAPTINPFLAPSRQLNAEDPEVNYSDHVIAPNLTRIGDFRNKPKSELLAKATMPVVPKEVIDSVDTYMADMEKAKANETAEPTLEPQVEETINLITQLGKDTVHDLGVDLGDIGSRYGFIDAVNTMRGLAKVSANEEKTIVASYRVEFPLWEFSDELTMNFAIESNDLSGLIIKLDDAPAINSVELRDLLNGFDGSEVDNRGEAVYRNVLVAAQEEMVNFQRYEFSDVGYYGFLDDFGKVYNGCSSMLGDDIVDVGLGIVPESNFMQRVMCVRSKVREDGTAVIVLVEANRMVLLPYTTADLGILVSNSDVYSKNYITLPYNELTVPVREELERTIQANLGQRTVVCTVDGFFYELRKINRMPAGTTPEYCVALRKVV